MIRFSDSGVLLDKFILQKFKVDKTFGLVHDHRNVVRVDDFGHKRRNALVCICADAHVALDLLALRTLGALFLRCADEGAILISRGGLEHALRHGGT